MVIWHARLKTMVHGSTRYQATSTAASSRTWRWSSTLVQGMTTAPRWKNSRISSPRTPCPSWQATPTSTQKTQPTLSSTTRTTSTTGSWPWTANTQQTSSSAKSSWTKSTYLVKPKRRAIGSIRSKTSFTRDHGTAASRSGEDLSDWTQLRTMPGSHRIQSQALWLTLAVSQKHCRSSAAF